MAGKLSWQEGTTRLQSYIMTGIVGIILVVGSLFYLKEEQRRLYKENQNLLLQRRLMEAYDSSLREQIELTRKMRHDIANHLQTLEELMHVVIPVSSTHLTTTPSVSYVTKSGDFDFGIMITASHNPDYDKDVYKRQRP